MNRLIITEDYKKKLKRFLKKHPNMAQPYAKTLKLLILDHQHPSLRLHPIRGQNVWSVSINMQYRITLELVVHEDGNILLVNVGDHSIYEAR